MSDPDTTHTSRRSTPDLPLSFSAAVGVVLGTIVLLAATQTALALIVAVLALVALLAAVALIARASWPTRATAWSRPSSRPSSRATPPPVPLNRRRHHLPSRRAA